MIKTAELLSVFCLESQHLTASRSDRHAHRIPRRQTRQVERRTEQLSAKVGQNARRPWQERTKAEGAQDITTTQDVRESTRPAPKSVMEHGTSGNDDRQPEKHNGDGGCVKDND